MVGVKGSALRGIIGSSPDLKRDAILTVRGLCLFFFPSGENLDSFYFVYVQKLPPFGELPTRLRALRPRPHRRGLHYLFSFLFGKGLKSC